MKEVKISKVSVLVGILLVILITISTISVFTIASLSNKHRAAVEENRSLSAENDAQKDRIEELDKEKTEARNSFMDERSKRHRQLTDLTGDVGLAVNASDVNLQTRQAVLDAIVMSEIGRELKLERKVLDQ